MDFIAVYRREDNPDLDGVPVALFRDGALMGTWHRTTEDVHNREMITRSVQLPDDIAYSQAAADHYAATAIPGPENAAYAQMVAEAKARLTAEAMQRAAEAQARNELWAESSMSMGPIDSPRFGVLDGDEEEAEAEAELDEEDENEDGDEAPVTEPPTPSVAPIVSTPPTTESDDFGGDPASRVARINENSGGVVTPEEEAAMPPSTGTTLD